VAGRSGHFPTTPIETGISGGSLVHLLLTTSVADPDPDPDPPDPRAFGPPGSGSTSHRYGSGSWYGSGSFYHHAKIIRKTLIPNILLLFLTFYL
jgi:hypothetical protein